MLWGLGIVILLVGLVWLMGQPRTYRYRMTVEVDTPDGPRTGSVVREVEYVPSLPLLAASQFTLKQRGEAVAVDLPGGQTLFVLLHVDGHETIRAGFGQGRETDVKTLLDRAKADGETYTYPPSAVLGRHKLSYPPFVRFRDPAVPASVEKVDPEHLADSFGSGIALRRITMSMTDDPVTYQLDNRFSWLDHYKKSRLRLNGKTGAITSNELSDNLGTGAFQAGAK